jgi:hypothetical protein
VTSTTSRTATIVQLGIAQTLAWASSYYLPAIVAVPMARDLGVSTPTVSPLSLLLWWCPLCSGQPPARP